MAAYPNLTQLLTSTEVWPDDLKADRAVNGVAKVRAYYTSKKHQFQIKHTLVAADLTTFKAFYDANRALTWTFTWAADGVTYTCMFGSVPKLSFLGNSLTNVEFVAIEQ